MTAMEPGLAALLGAAIGGLLTGGAAVGAQVWASRSQANAAKEAYRQQDRVWHRDQRLEAHHAFLNQVNRLTVAIAPRRSAADLVIEERWRRLRRVALGLDRP